LLRGRVDERLGDPRGARKRRGNHGGAGDRRDDAAGARPRLRGLCRDAGSGAPEHARIAAASVNFGAATAKVTFDPARTDPDRVVARIRALGYETDAPAGETLLFDLRGMDCGDCARSVEKTVAALPGVALAAVNFGAATLAVTPSPGGRLATGVVTGVVARAGYEATLRGGVRTAARIPLWRERRLWPVAVAAALWLAATLLGEADAHPWLPVALFAAAIGLGGWPFARAGLQAVCARRLDMNVLMTVSALGAAVLGEWGEGGDGRRPLRLRLDAPGADARPHAGGDPGPDGPLAAAGDGPSQRRRGDRADSGPRPGDSVRVRPGERLPADGTVTTGASAVDQSAITGESIPVDRAPGDAVYAGTVNGQGSLRVAVTAPAADSTLAQIIHLVEEAQGSKAPSQATVDRFAAVYTPVVIAIAGLLALGGWLVADDPRAWVYRALTLLVIACPCALVISTPVAIVSAIGAATRRGVLVKGGAALEVAGSARSVAFDKTGTLTEGRPRVVSVVAADGGAAVEREVVALAAAVEALSEHPLGRAVVAFARHEGIAWPGGARIRGRTGARRPRDRRRTNGDRRQRSVGLRHGSPRRRSSGGEGGTDRRGRADAAGRGRRRRGGRRDRGRRHAASGSGGRDRGAAGCRHPPRRGRHRRHPGHRSDGGGSGRR
jgi:Cd2+/Zn2+-exporting ATPase